MISLSFVLIDLVLRLTNAAQKRRKSASQRKEEPSVFIQHACLEDTVIHVSTLHSADLYQYIVVY